MIKDTSTATTTSEIKQILPIEYVRDIEYQKVVVGKISKTKVGPALEFLKNVEVYQNNDLDHLKRVNKDPKDANLVNILLCCEEDRDKLDLSKLKDLSIEEFDVVEVSKYAPFTKEQYEKFKEPWPITFKKKAMDIIDFTANEKLKIETNMRKAIELAKQSYENGNRFNACILVDPNQKDKVLKEAMDNTERNIASVSHCVIKMANSFGEYCKSISKNTVKVKKSRNESVIQEIKPVEESKEPEEEKREVDPELVNKRPAEVDLESYFTSEDYYFCLGLDLYVVMEPCVMCAMALVHSRIARVFYSMPYQDYGQGGLNDKIQINNLQGLNHRYKVFCNVLNNEAVDAYKGLIEK